MPSLLADVLARTWLADRLPVRSDPGSDRAKDTMVAARGIERPPQIVGALRCPVIGVAEQRLGHTNVLGIVDRQFGRDNLTEQVRVSTGTEVSAEMGT